MTWHPVILRGLYEVTPYTHSCILQKPQYYSYQAGQYADLCLYNQRPTHDTTRTLSFASHPSEETLHLLFRYRPSNFKRELLTYRTGDTLLLSDPIGYFSLPPEPSRPLLFIAGGVGIAPFLSLLKEAVQQAYKGPIRLVVSNRTPQDAVGIAEAETLLSKLPNGKLTTVFTRGVRQNRITSHFLENYIRELRNPMSYSAGPPTLVEAINVYLSALGVPDQDIRMEAFTGYDEA